MAAKARQTSTVTPAMIRFLRPVFSIAASYSIPCKVLRTAYALRNGRNQRGVGGASKGGQGPVPPLNCRSRRDEGALGQRVLPESSLGKAISYVLGLWTGLTRFLDDPRIPLDNNHTERGLRSIVLGRRNHYGSRSRRGTHVAALFYSLIESAKLSGVEPKRYLLTATRAGLVDRAAITLPRDLLESC